MWTKSDERTARFGFEHPHDPIASMREDHILKGAVTILGFQFWEVRKKTWWDRMLDRVYYRP